MAEPSVRLGSIVRRILAAEATSGMILIVVAVAAFVWANSAAGPAYEVMKNYPIGVQLGAGGLVKPAILWVNDLLMALFFFLVGLEIKRELMVGELVGWQRASLPVVGALGGMLVPAAIYALFNAGTAYSAGWGVPMATDIAFAVGVLALLGSRVPAALKIFLLALAIVDDLGAVIVIAVFYTAEISLSALALSLAAVLAAFIYGRRGGAHAGIYALIGAVAWFCMLKSGVHATIAGVLLALTVPVGHTLHRFEHALVPWIAYAIMPIFALFNAGVALGGGEAGLFGTAAIGAALGLLIGKPLGIVGFVWLAERARLINLPAGVGWGSLFGIGLLAGIGFTMALFVAGLAFPDPAALDQAKIGVMAGSVVAAILGLLCLRRTLAPKAQEARTAS